MATTLATPQQALERTDLERRFAVYIDGVPTDVIGYDGQHGVEQEIATARLVLALPRPAQVRANATVEVQAGWNNLVGTVFGGRIPAWTAALEERGALLTVRPVGWASLLAWPEPRDLVYQGPVGLRDIFLSLCARRGLPSYQADAVTAPDGTTEIRLGGNPRHEGGAVTIPGGQPPLAWLNAACEPFGYRVFDSPSGTVRLRRVSGQPPGDPVVTFTEGMQLASVRRGHVITGIVNYWDVRGITYEDELGASIPIRSIAEEVEGDPNVPVNGGVSYRRYDHGLLVTQELADIARNVKEIDHSAPDTPVTWESIGVPGVEPGDTVRVESEAVEASGSCWLTGLDYGVSEREGFHGSYRGWAGAGRPLPAGVDRIEIPLQATPMHLGDETVAWYAQPAPVGRAHEWTFTVPERATAVNVVGLAHGCNSQFIGGSNTDLTVSRFELWRPEESERAESSGNLPVMNEDYALRRDYRNVANWAPFAINLRGTEAGQVKLKVMSGQNRRATLGPWDDFELRDVVVHVYGARDPVLPTEGE